MKRIPDDRKTITARIERDIDGKGLWMIISPLEGVDGAVWPIQEDEIEPIMMAAANWLMEHNPDKKLFKEKIGE